MSEEKVFSLPPTSLHRQRLEPKRRKKIRKKRAKNRKKSKREEKGTRGDKREVKEVTVRCRLSLSLVRCVPCQSPFPYEPGESESYASLFYFYKSSLKDSDFLSLFYFIVSRVALFSFSHSHSLSLSLYFVSY